MPGYNSSDVRLNSELAELEMKELLAAEATENLDTEDMDAIKTEAIIEEMLDNTVGQVVE